MSSSARRAAHGAKNSKAVQTLARAGFAASGVVHILIGIIAISLAVGGGSGGGSADQSGALQHFDVFGNRRERHIKGRRQLADPAGRLRQPRDHRPSCGIGERMEYRVKLFALIVYHMVKYSPEVFYCQPFG